MYGARCIMVPRRLDRHGAEYDLWLELGASFLGVLLVLGYAGGAEEYIP